MGPSCFQASSFEAVRTSGGLLPTLRPRPPARLRGPETAPQPRFLSLPLLPRGSLPHPPRQGLQTPRTLAWRGPCGLRSLPAPRREAGGGGGALAGRGRAAGGCNFSEGASPAGNWGWSEAELAAGQDRPGRPSPLPLQVALGACPGLSAATPTPAAPCAGADSALRSWLASAGPGSLLPTA